MPKVKRAAKAAAMEHFRKTGDATAAAALAGVTPRAVKEWTAPAAPPVVPAIANTPAATAAVAAMVPVAAGPPPAPGTSPVDIEKLTKALLMMQRITVRSAAIGAAISTRIPVTDPFVQENMTLSELEKASAEEMAPYAAEYAPFLFKYVGPLMAMGFAGQTFMACGARIISTGRYARVYHERKDAEANASASPTTGPGRIDSFNRPAGDGEDKSGIGTIARTL
jgi:hypothetical protein